ncbi:MAG: helix-turn-helix domain-containing protein [Bilophila wadsworthia]
MARQCPGAGNRSGAGRGPCRRRRHRAFRSSRPDLRSRGFRTHRKTAARPRSETPARRARRTAGNVREAAKLLGISRGGFYVNSKSGLNPTNTASHNA